MATKDYYKSLGIEKNASEADIKSAFRKMARQYHPDVNKDKSAQDKFKEVNEAYQILSDPNKRKQYDQFGSTEGFDINNAGFNGASYGDASDIFSNFGDIFENFGFGDVFGQRSGARGGGSGQNYSRRKGEDIRVDVSLTLEEVVKGVEKEINIRFLDSCDICGGTGSKGKKTPEVCKTCGGRGEVRQNRQTMLGTISTVTVCPHCHGEGKVLSDPCPSCSGSGRAARSHSIKVKLPAGVETGSKLRVSGEGNVGQRGGARGDLYVYIEVQRHKKFTREGYDLHSSEHISFTQAALGDEVDIATISGNVKLKIPAGTQNGTSFRLKSKGIPHLGHHNTGEHYVSVIIDVPNNLNGDEKVVIEYLAFLRKENNSYAKSGNIVDRMKKIIK